MVTLVSKDWICTYRVYRLDALDRVASADYLQAADDDEACRLAQATCDGVNPAAEIWQGKRLVGMVSRHVKPTASRAA
jgi:hypothetical protein